jgi:hypothetical protein
MVKFWWHVFQEALEHSLKWIGEEPAKIFMSVLVFVLIGLFIIGKQGWPKGWAEMKERTLKVLGEDLLIVIGIFILILGFHMARDSFREWEHAEQRERKTKTEFDTYRQQTEKNKPELEPKIEDIWTAPAGDKENSVVGVDGRINNLGAPGTPEEFWIDIRFDDGRVVRGEIAARPAKTDKIFLAKNVQGQWMSISGAEYWVNQSEIIPTYGHLDGFLMAIVKNVTTEEIRTKQAVLILTCSDITGAKHSAERRFSPRGILYHLGIGGLQKPIPKH